MKQKLKKKEKIRFEARDGCRISNNQAEIYGKRIYELMQKKNRTTITAKEILEDARSKNTPYHNHFTWKNDIAAEKYRLEQARHLISSIVIVRIRTEDTEPIQVRAFVNVIDTEGDKGYVPIDIAISNPKTASQIIQQALREAKAWNNRYNEYQELSKIHRAIKEELQEFILEE